MYQRHRRERKQRASTADHIVRDTMADESAFEIRGAAPLPSCREYTLGTVRTRAVVLGLSQQDLLLPTSMPCGMIDYM